MVLRRWRTLRRMSQMELALECGVSARHMSFLETGRARPSREMVLTICDGLALPRSARNDVLQAAGFAPVFPRSPLESSALAPFRRVLTQVMQRHDPWPAMLVDRHWTIVDTNTAARALLAPLHGGDREMNVVRMLATSPLAPVMVANLPDMLTEMQARLQLEALHSGTDPVLRGLLDLVQEAVTRLGPGRPPSGPREPLVPLRLNTPSGQLAFLTTVAHFGTSEDITVQDLRLELLFPADDATQTALGG
jgi:transcriptional regulator with XRE-family HTH domain